MKKRYRLPSVFILLFILITDLMYGQATRTWTSGVGDDVNPCSRTAPCKTFAGAISKTAASGEINVLDPGGYGAVTIAKSITIDGTNSFASILSAGTNGIIINAGAEGVVILRHLSINGAGTGINGIRILAAAKVQIEDCYLSNFTQKGIEINTTTACAVVISNVTIHNADEGIAINNAGGSVSIDKCRLQFFANAAISLSNGLATISNSNIAGAGTGIRAGANTSALLTNNVISNNMTGLQGPGKISSTGNNLVANNKSQGSSTDPVKLQ